MKHKRKHLGEMRAIADDLARLAERKIAYMHGASRLYNKLRKHVQMIQKLELTIHQRADLRFALEVLYDKAVQKLVEPVTSRSVWALPVPFEMKRRKH